MIKVYFHTNLDLSGEQWPDELPAVPRVGDHIVSRTKHGQFQLSLQVCRVTWKFHKGWHVGEGSWVPEIELHMTDFQKGLRPKDNPDGDIGVGSITAFYQWYAPLVGKSVSAFI